MSLFRPIWPSSWQWHEFPKSPTHTAALNRNMLTTTAGCSVFWKALGMSRSAIELTVRIAHVSAEREGHEGGSLSAPGCGRPRRHLPCGLSRTFLSLEQEAWLCWLHRLYTLQIVNGQESGDMLLHALYAAADMDIYIDNRLYILSHMRRWTIYCPTARISCNLVTCLASAVPIELGHGQSPVP